MRALGLDYNTRQPAEFDIPEPQIVHPDDVLLQIQEVGVCATDRELAEFRFGRPPDGEHCLALGHEALARVVECGRGVRDLKSGDWVVPMIRRSCAPACIACGRGRRDLCVSGAYAERGINGAHGYFVPLAVDAAADLVKIPPDIVDIAVLVEPLSVVEKAFDRALAIHPLTPQSILIFGAGPVGLLAAFAAVARGLDCEIVSIEPEDSDRAAIARRAGARYSHRYPSNRADLVFEASGSPAAARTGLDWLNPLGVMVLIGASDFDIRFPGLRSVVNNLTMCGIVNAGPEHLQNAVHDLARFDRNAVSALLSRLPLCRWKDSLTTSNTRIKTVHTLLG